MKEQGAYDIEMRTTKGLTKGYTPLHIAAEDGSVDFIRFLIAERADVNAKDDDEWMGPIHNAVAEGEEVLGASPTDAPLCCENTRRRREPNR